MSNEPVTNENITDELQEKPAAFEVPIDLICDISVTDSYEIPIRYIEEDDWEDLPDE